MNELMNKRIKNHSSVSTVQWLTLLDGRDVRKGACTRLGRALVKRFINGEASLVKSQHSSYRHESGEFPSTCLAGK